MSDEPIVVTTRRAPQHLTSEEVKAYNKAYYAAHAEELRARRRVYYQANAEQERAYGRSYNNSERGKEVRREFAVRSEATLDGYIKMRFRGCRTNAEKRGISVSALIKADTLQALWASQNGRCAVTGMQMHLGDGDFNRKGSIDRIDSSVGYEPENIRWVCFWVNQAKSDGSDAELLDWCTAVARGLEASPNPSPR
jgi:hypothetical protein